MTGNIIRRKMHEDSHCRYPFLPPLQQSTFGTPRPQQSRLTWLTARLSNGTIIGGAAWRNAYARTSYCFARCQVHPDFADVQGWFLEVQGDNPRLVAALHKSITAKYCSMLGQDSHGCGSDATRLAAAWLQSLESALQEGDVLVNPAGGFVAKRDLIVLAEIKRRDLTWPEQFADEIITISRVAATTTLLPLQQQGSGVCAGEVHHVSGGKTGRIAVRSG